MGLRATHAQATIRTIQDQYSTEVGKSDIQHSLIASKLFCYKRRFVCTNPIESGKPATDLGTDRQLFRRRRAVVLALPVPARRQPALALPPACLPGASSPIYDITIVALVSPRCLFPQTRFIPAQTSLPPSLFLLSANFQDFF